MIKLTKKLVVISTIIILVLLLLSRAYVSDKIGNSNLNLSDYNARKEDLILKQEQLQVLIITLNNTIQQEIIKQTELANKLSSLTGKPSSSPISGGSSSSTPTPNPTPAPAPSPTPQPPVTRAS